MNIISYLVFHSKNFDSVASANVNNSKLRYDHCYSQISTSVGVFKGVCFNLTIILIAKNYIFSL